MPLPPLPPELWAEQSFSRANGSSFVAGKWPSLPAGGYHSHFAATVILVATYALSIYCVHRLCVALRDTGEREDNPTLGEFGGSLERQGHQVGQGREVARGGNSEEVTSNGVRREPPG